MRCGDNSLLLTIDVDLAIVSFQRDLLATCQVDICYDFWF